MAHRTAYRGQQDAHIVCQERLLTRQVPKPALSALQVRRHPSWVHSHVALEIRKKTGQCEGLHAS